MDVSAAAVRMANQMAAIQRASAERSRALKRKRDADFRAIEEAPEPELPDHTPLDPPDPAPPIQLSSTPAVYDEEANPSDDDRMQSVIIEKAAQFCSGGPELESGLKVRVGLPHSLMHSRTHTHSALPGRRGRPETLSSGSCLEGPALTSTLLG